MSAFRRLVRRIANVLRPEGAESDLAREVNAHLVLLEDEFRQRGLSDEDARRAAKHAFGGQQVRFRFPGPSERRWAPGNPDDAAGAGDWYEIIGVVRELGVGAPTQAGRAAGFYLPGTPDLFNQIQMLVHVRGGDPMTLAPKVRDVAMAVDPSLRLVDMQRVTEANNDVLWVMGLWLRITVVLSTVALVLSLAGIYAVLSFTVARRTREIGVRVALGASRWRVVAATFRRPLLQVALGIVVGTVGHPHRRCDDQVHRVPGFRQRPHPPGHGDDRWLRDCDAGRLPAGLRGADTPRAQHRADGRVTNGVRLWPTGCRTWNSMVRRFVLHSKHGHSTTE